MAVHEFNAHQFSDNFAVVNAATGQCAGTEHNREEAEALCRWLNNRSGGGYAVEANGPDAVRAATADRQARGITGPFRHLRREQAFEETGLWQRKRRN